MFLKSVKIECARSVTCGDTCLLETRVNCDWWPHQSPLLLLTQLLLTLCLLFYSTLGRTFLESTAQSFPADVLSKRTAFHSCFILKGNTWLKNLYKSTMLFKNFIPNIREKNKFCCFKKHFSNEIKTKPEILCDFSKETWAFYQKRVVKITK